MEKKTISAGIIGAGGFIGQEHLKRLTKQIDGAVVTALYDINKEKTDALAAEYGAENMESVDALIASDKVDAIVVTAWDGVHAEVTSKAIAAGKPVFFEKPLTTTKADCVEIVRAMSRPPAGIWCRSALCAAMTRITARSRPFWIPVSWASR